MAPDLPHNILNASSPLITIGQNELWILFGFLALVALVMTAILFYHWHTYSQKFLTTIVMDTVHVSVTGALIALTILLILSA